MSTVVTLEPKQEPKQLPMRMPVVVRRGRIVPSSRKRVRADALPEFTVYISEPNAARRARTARCRSASGRVAGPRCRAPARSPATRSRAAWCLSCRTAYRGRAGPRSSAASASERRSTVRSEGARSREPGARNERDPEDIRTILDAALQTFGYVALTGAAIWAIFQYAG